MPVSGLREKRSGRSMGAEDDVPASKVAGGASHPLPDLEVGPPPLSFVSVRTTLRDSDRPSAASNTFRHDDLPSLAPERSWS